jgi:hypothetical protein
VRWRRKIQEEEREQVRQRRPMVSSWMSRMKEGSHFSYDGGGKFRRRRESRSHFS